MAARHDFDRHVAKQPRLPVYAIISQDPLLRREAVQALKAQVLTVAPDFNRDEIDAAAGQGERIVGAARMLPMMAPTRWVQVNDIDKLPAKEHPQLIAYLQAPVSSTVLCVQAPKLDQRTKLAQALSKSGALFVLEPPRQSDLPQWLQGRAKAAGYSIEPEAATLLCDLIGAELGNLMAEMHKLALFAGKGAEITTEHVGDLVAQTRVSSIFELTDALGHRDWLRASTLLHNIVEGGESGLLVLSMLTRQIRLLLQTKAAGQHRAQPLAQALGVRPFVAESLLQQARHYTEAELWTALQSCAAADVKLKSTRLGAQNVLDQLLLQLLTPAAA